MPTLQEQIYGVRSLLRNKFSKEIRSPGSTDLTTEQKACCATIRAYGASIERELRTSEWYALWDASNTGSILSVLSSVAAVDDLSGSGNMLLGSVEPPSYGVRAINGLSVIDMLDASLSVAAAYIPQPFTIFFVGEVDVDSASLFSSSGGGSMSLGVTGGYLDCPGVGSLAMPTGTPSVIAATFDGDDSKTTINGISNVAGNSTDAIGSDWLVGDAMDGAVAQCAIHAGRLPVTRIEEIYAELATKWGISI